MSPELTLGLESNAVTVANAEGGPKLSVADAQLLNAQGKALGFQNEDLLVKLNGEEIPYNSEFKNFFQRQQESLQAGKKLSYSVLRKDSTGTLKEVELSADAIVVEREVKHLLGVNAQATPEQVSLRNAWIGE
jgi:hypothetical protein